MESAEFANGAMAVQIAIGFILVEAIVLSTYYAARRQGIPPVDLLPSLGAGLFLMLAVLAALRNAPTPWIAFWLGASGVAHLTDLYRRWHR